MPMRRSSWLLLGAGILGAWIAFSGAFDNPLRDDDLVFLRHVTAHPSLHGLLQPTTTFSFYRPGALVLFLLEHKLFGSAGGHYLFVNGLLHVAIAFTMCVVLRGIGVAETAAALATALFLAGLCHYDKQVMWACTSGPMASVLLSLLAIACALRFAAPRTGRRVAWGSAAWTAVALAPLFHEAGIIAPILLVPVLGWRGRRAVGRLAVFALPATAWTLCLLVLSHRYPAYREAAPQVWSIPVQLFRYPGFMLFPVQGSQLAAAPAVQLMLSLAVLACGIRLARHGPRQARILIAWTYVALMPFCLIALPGWWLEMRYLYFAAVPACGLIALLLVALHARSGTAGRRFVMAGGCILVGLTLVFEIALERKYDAYARQPGNSGELQASAAPLYQ